MRVIQFRGAFTGHWKFNCRRKKLFNVPLFKCKHLHVSGILVVFLLSLFSLLFFLSVQIHALSAKKVQEVEKQSLSAKTKEEVRNTKQRTAQWWTRLKVVQLKAFRFFEARAAIKRVEIFREIGLSRAVQFVRERHPV